MPVQFDALTALRYLAAQGARDHGLRRAHGISKRAMARAAGISPRSLDRYLKGERSPPEGAALRLSVLAEDKSSELREIFQLETIDEEIPYVAPSSFPLSIRRYDRPRSTTGKDERSEIIEVDTEGLSYAQINHVLIGWWNYLKKRGGKWDVRFMVLVSVREYFGREGPKDRELRKRVRGEKHVPMWVPPVPFLFVDDNKRRVAGKYKNANDAVGVINEMFEFSYSGRMPLDYGILRISFVPFLFASKPQQPRKRRRK